MLTRSSTKACDTIKKYMNNIHTEQFCSRRCKVVHLNALYSYMISDEVSHILLRPQFADFRLALMKKSDELRIDADNEKSRLGAWGLGGIETYNEYNKLIEKSIEMMMFLEDNGVPTPYASSKSPTKKVKPVSINNVKVLPRRSARLMEKKNANAVV